MSNWFVSKKLTFNVYEYAAMQLLHEYSYDQETQEHVDNGRGKIILTPREGTEGFHNSTIDMTFLTYEEAAEVKEAFNDFITEKYSSKNTSFNGACASSSRSKG